MEEADLPQDNDSETIIDEYRGSKVKDPRYSESKVQSKETILDLRVRTPLFLESDKKQGVKDEQVLPVEGGRESLPPHKWTPMGLGELLMETLGQHSGHIAYLHYWESSGWEIFPIFHMGEEQRVAL